MSVASPFISVFLHSQHLNNECATGDNNEINDEKNAAATDSGPTPIDTTRSEALNEFGLAAAHSMNRLNEIGRNNSEPIQY